MIERNIKKMAKKNYGIADAIRSEIKTPAPVATPEELDVVQTELDIPAETETASETVDVKPAKKKVGRPRKTAEDAEERSAPARVALEPSLKKKLRMVCVEKGVSENDYLYALVSKSVTKDFNNLFAGLVDGDN